MYAPSKGDCASRNFLIEEKKLYLNGPCKSVASRWRFRITYTVESCYANFQQRFVFPPGIRLEKGCPIPVKDSIVARSILSPYMEERIVYVLEEESGSLVFYGIYLVGWKRMARVKKDTRRLEIAFLFPFILQVIDILF